MSVDSRPTGGLVTGDI